MRADDAERHEADGQERPSQADLPEEDGAEQPERAGHAGGGAVGTEPDGPPAARPCAQQVAHASARGHHLADGGDVLRDQVPAPEGDDPGDRRAPTRTVPGDQAAGSTSIFPRTGTAATRRADVPNRAVPLPAADPTQGQARTDQPAHLVAPDLAVADRPEPVHLAPGRQQRPDVPQVPRPRAERAPGPGRDGR